MLVFGYQYSCCVCCKLSMSTDRPAKLTFKLLQLSTPAPVTLLLLHDKHQHILVSPKQVHNSCLGGHCTYPAFYRQCRSLNKPLVLTEQDSDLQQLIQLAGMSNTVSKLSLVTLAACCQAMAKASFNVPPQLLASFVQVKDKAAEQTLEISQHGSNPAQVQMLRPFPVSLPVCQVPSSKFGQRYGLDTKQSQHLLTTTPLSQQLTALHSYYTTTIRLDREGHYYKYRTWQNIHTQCALFLGYCLTYHLKEQPNLEFFLDPTLIIHFVSCHIAAKHSLGTIRGFLFAAKKVIQWWARTPGGQHDSFREGFAWLQALHTQVQQSQHLCTSYHSIRACCTSVQKAYTHSHHLYASFHSIRLCCVSVQKAYKHSQHLYTS